jgi:putative RNA 2'-phosphotransferase
VDADLVQDSKRLSLVLRHRPDEVGVTLDESGWVDVERLLAAMTARGWQISRDRLSLVVDTNDKQRFEWDLETDRIRARQGHSVEVDLGLAAATPPDVLFHGTPTRNLDAILQHGLDRRRRHHVHLSGDTETAQRVGARRGAHVVLVVDAARMHADGHEFRVSGNGVWLSDEVPVSYLSVWAP